jgi:prolyl oligopeptidase
MGRNVETLPVLSLLILEYMGIFYQRNLKVYKYSQNRCWAAIGVVFFLFLMSRNLTDLMNHQIGKTKPTLMKNKNYFLLLAMILVLVQCTTREELEKPPLAPVQEVVDNYYGVDITDPYRYMENMEDTVVSNWMKAQSDYARATLDRISSRKGLVEMMEDFDSRVSSSVYNLTITDTDRYFYLKQTPEDETGKLFTRNGFAGEESLLLDPSAYRPEDSLDYVISAVVPTNDGSKIAITLAPNGSENASMIFMDVDSKEFYPEEFDRCSFGTNWLSDGNSVLFHRWNSSDVHDPNRQINTSVYWHELGNDPSEVKVIFSGEKYPELEVAPQEIPVVFYDRNNDMLYAFIYTVDPRLKIYFAPASDLENETIEWRKLFDPEDEVTNFLSDKDYFYAMTFKDAPNFKVLKSPITNPDWSAAEVFIPEDYEMKLGGITQNSAGFYFVRSRYDVEMKLYHIANSSDEIMEVELPWTAGSLSVSSKGLDFPDLWVSASGWTMDSKRYRYNRENGEFIHEQLSDIAEYPEYADLVVEEMLVPSHDGVEVPVSLIYNRSTPLDGSASALIMGYGSYGSSITPFFSPNFLLWTHEGGILVISHVRGGGEKGDAWRLAGSKVNKPNTWKDLIATAEFLVDNSYTSEGKIAINGGSAGGILIGRAMTDRPDLFAAAIPEVGVMNTLRAEESPNGPVNAPEFGTVMDSVECMALIEMDSYLNIEDGVQYPATLITAGMNDPRVIAWQPGKFAARLLTANASDKPILFFVDYEAGHGIGNTKSKGFESLADVMAFGLWQTGHPKYRFK